MSSYKTEIQHLNYNAATRRFEALVIMHEGSEMTKYPTSLPLPINSDFSSVSRKLVAEAKKQRSQRSGTLISRAPAEQVEMTHLANLARQLGDSFGLTSVRRAA